MAKFRFDVGLVVYHEVIVVADDLESAKSSLDVSCKELKEGNGFTNTINTDAVEWNMAQKDIEYYGIKVGSTVQIHDEVLE